MSGWGSDDDGDGGWDDDTEEEEEFDEGDENESKKKPDGCNYEPEQKKNGKFKMFKVFKVMLDQEFYRPGETINGEFIFRPKKKLKLKKIRLKWVGTVSTKWKKTVIFERTENIFMEYETIFPTEEDEPVAKASTGKLKGFFKKKKKKRIGRKKKCC